jgi:Uma2 family endonuclease
MGALKLRTRIGVEDYLAGERASETRHEYVEGEAYAMSGASDRHNRIALGLASRLDAHLAGKRCETFMSDMKLRAGAEVFYYPDVMVTCDDPRPDVYWRAEAVLVVEVSSPTTARVDLHEKLAAYRAMPTLREYVIVAQEEMRIQAHRRGADGSWSVEIFDNAEEAVTLESVGLTLSVADIYRNVRPAIEASADAGE